MINLKLRKNVSVKNSGLTLQFKEEEDAADFLASLAKQRAPIKISIYRVGK